MNLYLIFAGLVLCFSTSSRGHRRNVKTSSVHNEGRIEDFDNLISMNIELINSNRPEFMGNIVEEAEIIAKSKKGDSLADYYLKLLKNIQAKGIDFVHDERERLNLIIGTTQGAENEGARYEKNIVEGLVDMIAEHLMTASMTGDLDMMGSFTIMDMMNKHKPRDEI